jgi:hypothetical protein
LTWAAIAALMTAIFFYLALASGMLRDAGALEGHKRPWSLGVAFVLEVWRTLAMPEFNSTLLALMGISAAGYVGFKFPEAPKAGT